jgi:hypothetical protein
MTETVIQIRVDGTAEIYQGGRQHLRVLGDDGEPRWHKRTSQGLRPVGNHRARRLERIYAHRENVKAFRRRPRLPAEVVAAEAKSAYIVELEQRAFDWIARGHEANIQLGRVFLQLKDIIDYGDWEAYFAEKFETRGIPLRTGQHYMQLAKDADAVSANVELFPEATDPKAQAINRATEQASEAVSNADPQSSVHQASESAVPGAEKLEDGPRTHRLAIRMMQKQWSRISTLWSSEHRGLGEAAVTDCLMEVCDRCGIASIDPQEGQTRI